MMVIDMKKYENIRTIQKLLNIEKDLAEKIYKEAGTDLDKIYSSLRNPKNVICNEKLYSRCLRCGRVLKTIEAQISGYGSICKDKVKSNGLRKKSFIGDDYGIKSTTKRTGGEKH